MKKRHDLAYIFTRSLWLLVESRVKANEMEERTLGNRYRNVVMTHGQDNDTWTRGNRSGGGE